MASFLLILLILLSGFLSGLEKEKRFNLFKAFIMVGIETLLGSIIYLLVSLLIFQTPIKDILLVGIESIFVIILLIAVIIGIILYWLNRIIIPKFKINKQVQTLCEYIIQWSLIYITVYQVVFDNILSTIKTNSKTIETLENISITNPTDLIILVLPTLISVWISIILYKVKTDEL